MKPDEIKKALEYCSEHEGCHNCPCENECGDLSVVTTEALNYINQLEAENEKLKEKALEMRRKALLEAFSKFAGHSDYHGDVILSKLKCMAEGKEVDVAIPLDKNKIKTEAIKEFAEKLATEYKTNYYLPNDDDMIMVAKSDMDNLVKEMVGENNGI